MKRMRSIFAIILAVLMAGCVSFQKSRQPIPANAFKRLQAGNDRFLHHRMKHPDQSAARIAETAKGQKPFAAIVTCSDSRVSPEIIFDEGIGDLFVIRNAGNIVEEEDVLASIEYAVEHLGVHTVIVMGHEHCGAIEAMTHELSDDEPAHIVSIVERLKNEPEEQEALRSGEVGEQLIHHCVVANVEHGVSALHRELEHLKGHHSGADVTVLGAVYDIRTGGVQFLNTAGHH